MNFLISLATGATLGAATLALTRNRSNESRATIALGTAAAIAFPLYVYLVANHPEADNGEPVAKFAVFLRLLPMIIVGSICSFVMSRFRDGGTQGAVAIVGLVLIAGTGFVAFKDGLPREKRSAQIDFPAIGHFAKDRKTREIDGKVLATSYGIKTADGRTGPGVQVEFNEGYRPWFLLDQAYDRWEFTADRNGAKNSAPALGSPSKPAATDPQPGQKLYTPDQGRYGGKILEVGAQGVHVEFFNGKREWVQPVDLHAKWTLR